ncbi:3'-5' exonuclease [Streptomyces sp. CA-106131]|uniref:3'-5' exonuclease n=1 Tax=Streptomyces sp. CA-106131 TaxID=3240045 RepID=UPI003D8F15D7
MLVLDVEGNGTNPPDLVEVATLPVRDGRPDKTTAGAWLTRPNRPVTPFATRVHGLSNHDLANKPGWDEIADQVRTFMGTAWICAHNAHTDYRVLRAHLPGWEPTGLEWPAGRALRDGIHAATDTSRGRLSRREVQPRQ